MEDRLAGWDEVLRHVVPERVPLLLSKRGKERLVTDSRVGDPRGTGCWSRPIPHPRISMSARTAGMETPKKSRKESRVASPPSDPFAPEAVTVTDRIDATASRPQRERTGARPRRPHLTRTECGVEYRLPQSSRVTTFQNKLRSATFLICLPRDPRSHGDDAIEMIGSPPSCGIEGPARGPLGRSHDARYKPHDDARLTAPGGCRGCRASTRGRGCDSWPPQPPWLWVQA